MPKGFKTSIGQIIKFDAREHKTHPIALMIYEGSAYTVSFLTAEDAEEMGRILTSLGIIHAGEGDG